MAKKRWKKKRGRPAKAASPLSLPLPRKAGRPREIGVTVGPTPETVAKLRPDILHALVLAEILTPDEASAGREILDAWAVLTAGLDARTSTAEAAGYSATDAPRAERLQERWRLWAAELPARVHVRPAVVVELMRGDRPCDRDAKGSAGIVARAIRWWRDVGRGGRPAAQERPARLQVWRLPVAAE